MAISPPYNAYNNYAAGAYAQNPFAQSPVAQNQAYTQQGYNQAGAGQSGQYGVYQQQSPVFQQLENRQFQPEIKQALQILNQIQHLPGDMDHLKAMGVNPVFNNGAEALNLILSKGIRVEFGDMGDSWAHAQWIADENLIMINQNYQGDFSKEALYGISEAIYHEAGHAALNGDGVASIQEEIDCLALNTLGYRYHTYTDPEFAQTANNSKLIQDGVAVYGKLFFDADPQKQALVNRIISRYGTLPPETPDHRIPFTQGQVPLADRILRQMKVIDAVQQFPGIEQSLGLKMNQTV